MALQTRYQTVQVDVELSATRLRRYEIASGDEGWLFYDRIVDLSKQQQLLSTFLPEGTLLEFGALPISTTVVIDRPHLKGAILRPYLRQAPQLIDGAVVALGTDWVKQTYAFWPTDYSYWDFTRSESGLFIECTQKYLYPAGTAQSAIDNHTAQPLYSAVGYNGSSLGDDSYVGMCPNGFFAAGVRRAALADEAVKYLEANVSYSDAEYTNIRFGNDRWCLRLPLIGAPVLYENLAYVPSPPGWEFFYPHQWVMRPWTDGKLSAINPHKAAREGVTYRIGAIGHAVCVTESNFEDDFAYFVVGDDTPVDPQILQPVIPAGTVLIENWPGQCTTWLDLLQFPEEGWVYRYPFDIPSYHRDRLSMFAWSEPTSLPEVDGCTVGEVVAGEATGPAGGLGLHYSVPLIRGQYPGSGLVVGDYLHEELLTYTTPFLEALTAYQDSNLTENVVLWQKLDNHRLDLELSAESGNSSAQHHTLKVDNRPITNPLPAGKTAPESGYVPTGDLSPGRQVRLKAGWIYEQSSEGRAWTKVPAVVPQGEYVIVEPSRNAREGSFELTDLLGLLHLKKWEWGDLCARGWYVADFVDWLLQDAGLGPAWYDLEDLQTLIPDDNERSTWKLGCSYAQIIAECVDRFGHGIIAPGSGATGQHHVGASFWYDGQDNVLRTGCRYCRTKRALDDWQSHEDDGWNSSGCLAADAARIEGGVDLVMVDTPLATADFSSLYLAKSVQCKVTPLAADKYANRIVVVGRSTGADRQPIISRWSNPVALYHGEGTPPEEYLGLPVTHVEEDSSLTTRALTDARLSQLVQQLSSWPRLVSITAPFLSTTKPGHVVTLTSGKYVGVHGSKFRITSVNHRLRSHETTLEAREMTGLGGGA